MRAEQLDLRANGRPSRRTLDGSAPDGTPAVEPEDAIAVVLSRLEDLETGPMSRLEAEHTLGLLGRFLTVVESKRRECHPDEIGLRPGPREGPIP